MSTIDARAITPPVRTVSEAIDTSIAQTEIVFITDPGLSRDAIIALLVEECEGSVETAEIDEFWGVDVDGAEWRVHVYG